MIIDLKPTEINKIKELFKIDETNRVLSDFILDYLDNAKKIAKKHSAESLYLDIKKYYDFDKSFEKEIKDYHLEKNIKELDENVYLNNHYVKNINLTNVKYKNYKFVNNTYLAYEGFLYDFIKVDKSYKEITSIGYFTKDFKYLSLNVDDSIWMLITPHEINTMQPCIDKATKNILVLGLGLGYFPYMASLKEDVTSITIVERDETIIELFTKYILKQFKNKDKIKIIHDDALLYLKNNELNYDYYFVDLWHDVDDGLETYLNFSNILKNYNTDYWIEESMLIVIRRCILTYLFEQIYKIENNYTDEENFYDHLINRLNTIYKDVKISTYADIISLISIEGINKIKNLLLD